jgi:hypothetical protein
VQALICKGQQQAKTVAVSGQSAVAYLLLQQQALSKKLLQ